MDEIRSDPALETVFADQVARDEKRAERIEQEAVSRRPRPPASLIGVESVSGPMFVPAPELVTWFTDTFIREDGPLYNEDHIHLNVASFGALWTNVSNARAGRAIVGQAETGKPNAMGKWTRGKLVMLSNQWFGEEPDFVLTFYADYAADCDDTTFCALVEHELYHCGQQQDEFGAPKFSKQSGLPVFTMRGHDVEEFVGVVRRYGAIDPGIAAMVEFAGKGAEVAQASIASVCGTCAAKG